MKMEQPVLETGYSICSKFAAYPEPVRSGSFKSRRND